MSFGEIIAKVKAHPELWQSAHPFYRHRVVSARTWKQIAAELRADEIIIRKRWKHLKDQYRKEQKKVISNTIPMSFWNHYNDLHFLSDDMLTVNMKSLADIQMDNLEEKSDNSDSDDLPLKTKIPRRSSNEATVSSPRKLLLKTQKATGLEATRSSDGDWTQIKKRWKHMKDSFRKEVKKVTTKQIEQSSWIHYDELDFLTDEILKKQIIPESEGSDNETETKMKPVTKIIRKRKRLEQPVLSETTSQSSIKFKKIIRSLNTLCKHVGKSTNFVDDDLKNDPDYMFLVSLLPTMKNLSDIQRLHFRGKINNWLLSALMENEFSDCDSKANVQSQINQANLKDCKIELEDDK